MATSAGWDVVIADGFKFQNRGANVARDKNLWTSESKRTQINMQSLVKDIYLVTCMELQSISHISIVKGPSSDYLTTYLIGFTSVIVSIIMTKPRQQYFVNGSLK